ncbi:MAG: glycosyltransferase [Flavobacteriaceae bacterium]|nr:glycosyltransferase [Flavobacteriaceae bacterium]
MNYKYSIVTPVFNASSFLNQAIDSVLEQEVQDWELIIINDASKDDSFVIAHSFAQKDDRIKVIDFHENKGQGYARNVALQKAKGKYILFLDADDFFSKRAFSTLSDYIDRKPKIKVFLWGYHVCNHKGKIQQTLLPDDPNKAKKETPILLGMLSRKGFVAFPWVYIIKKKFIQKHDIRFLEGVFFEDVPFNIQVLYHLRKMKTIPFAGYNYRKHPSSVTGQSSKQKIDDKFTAFTWIKTFLEKKSVFHIYQNLYLARFLAFCVYTCFNDYLCLPRKNKDKALDHDMENIRKGSWLTKENLQLLKTIGLLLKSQKEHKVARFYLSAYIGLSNIKKRYFLQKFMVWLIMRVKRF